MKKSFFALFISSIFLLCACDEKEKRMETVQTQATQAVQPSEKAADKLNVETITLFKKGQEVNLNNDSETERPFNPIEPFFLSVQVPKTGLAWLDNQLLIEAVKLMLPVEEADQVFPYTADQPNLKSTLEAALAKYYEEYAKEVNESLAEIKKSEIEAGDATESNWQPPVTITSQYFSLEHRLSEQHGNIATFFLYFENYMGGAHGWHNGVTLNADLARQILMGVKDLIGDEENKEIALKNLLWESYKKYQIELATDFAKENKEPIPSEAEILENTFIKQEDIFISNSFQFTKEGVLFSYPPYAIGSYAEGQIELLVEWKDIQPLLATPYQKLPEYDFKSITNQ